MGDPVLVYDDDCGFCTWWAEFLAEHAALRVVGFSEVDPSLRERLPADYEECSHLVTDEGVHSCGASIEEALLRSDVGAAGRPVADFLRSVDAYRAAREWGYRHVAHNRSLWGKLLSKRPPARESGTRSDDRQTR